MLHHPDEGEVFVRVDLHVRGMGTAMAEPVGTDRKTEAVSVFDSLGSLALCQFGDGGLAQNLTVGLAPVQHHSAEFGRVLRRREEPPRRHGKAADAFGERVDELGDLEGFQLRFVFVRAVRLRETGDLSIIRPEGRVFHPERIEKALLHESLVGFSADDLEDAGGRVDPGVGVLVGRARFGLERSHRVGLHRRREREAVESGLIGGGFEGLGSRLQVVGGSTPYRACFG